MKKTLLTLAISFLTVNTYAVELVREATITSLGNTSNGTPDFYVRTTGGSGNCANALIKFPESVQASEASTNQAFSIALTAMTTGKKVRISNLSDDNCFKANHIEINE